jgi:hypothetical protein
MQKVAVPQLFFAFPCRSAGTGQLTKISCDNGATPVPKHAMPARRSRKDRRRDAAQPAAAEQRYRCCPRRGALDADPFRTGTPSGTSRRALKPATGSEIPVMRGRVFGQDYAKALAAERNNFRFDRTLRCPALPTCFGNVAALSLQQRAFAKQQQDFAGSACMPVDAPLGSPTNCETDW